MISTNDIDYIIEIIEVNSIFSQVFIFNVDIGQVAVFADRELISIVKNLVIQNNSISLSVLEEILDILDIAIFRIDYDAIFTIIFKVIVNSSKLNNTIDSFSKSVLDVINVSDIYTLIFHAIKTNDIQVVNKIITVFVKPTLNFSIDYLQCLITCAINSTEITKNINILKKILTLPKIKDAIDWIILDKIFDYVFKIENIKKSSLFLSIFGLFGCNKYNMTLVYENINSVSIINKFLGLVNNTIIDKNVYSKLCNYLLLSKIVSFDYTDINTNIKAVMIELKYNNILKFINKYASLDPVLYNKISIINIKYKDNSLISIPEELHINIKSFLIK